MKNGFTWVYSKDAPLPPRTAPYVSTAITPCKIRTAKATEFAKGQIAPPAKVADTNKRQALVRGGI